jgi:predicted RNase H-like nuclease (RuvC/YqgF family)
LEAENLELKNKLEEKEVTIEVLEDQVQEFIEREMIEDEMQDDAAINQVKTTDASKSLMM